MWSFLAKLMPSIMSGVGKVGSFLGKLINPQTIANIGSKIGSAATTVSNLGKNVGNAINTGLKIAENIPFLKEKIDNNPKAKQFLTDVGKTSFQVSDVANDIAGGAKSIFDSASRREILTNVD